MLFPVSPGEDASVVYGGAVTGRWVPEPSSSRWQDWKDFLKEEPGWEPVPGHRLTRTETYATQERER